MKKVKWNPKFDKIFDDYEKATKGMKLVRYELE